MEAYENHVGLVQFMMFTIAAAAVLPATFFMGATFPLTIRTVARGIGRVGRDVGGVYALNTLGAICGSFLSAFVFVPLFSRYLGGAGMQSTFYLSVAIYAALSVLLLSVTGGPRLRRLVVAAGTVVLSAVFFFAAPKWDPAAMTIGVFRLSLMTGALDSESWGDPDVKYYYDGVTTTVSVELWGRHFALKNNGKVDASNGDDMPTQIMIAAYPLLLHPAGPEGLDVAIVGFGSGVTVGAALEFPIARLDVVELENAVVEASRVFGSTEGERADAEFDVNHLVYRRERDPETGAPNPEFDWTDPDTYVINDRLRLIADDGRNFLTSTPRKFDVIVSEPSNPWITGVSNMFTQESFAAMAASLKPGGLFCQWVQLYELSPENVKVILRTFASVFPHVAWFSAEDLSSDTVILGSFEPINLDLAHIREVMRDRRTRAELERAYIFSASDVLARVLLVDRKEFDEYTTGLSPDPSALPINTDDNALIEFAAPRDLISFKRFAGYLAAIYTGEWQQGRLHRVVRGLGEGDTAEARDRAALALSLLANGRKPEAGRFLERAMELAEDEPAVARATRMAALLRGEGGRPVPELEEVEPPPGMSEVQAKELRDKVADVLRSLSMGADRDALERFSRIPQHLWSRGGPQLMLLKGYLHFLNADPEDTDECEEAIVVLSELVREDEAYVGHHPEIHFYLAMCHDNALNFDKAVKNVRRYVDLVDGRDRRMAIAVAQARANLEAALSGLSGTMPIALPPDPPGAPTTDAPGESPKDIRTE
ncbi:MAG: hypothetical protein JRI55_07105, partial [Deltaproteobacteria bacterium]|jgi:spermidine synthase|nr:hypothetical protein [Deltaproteobacteria bacterium]